MFGSGKWVILLSLGVYKNEMSSLFGFGFRVDFPIIDAPALVYCFIVFLNLSFFPVMMINE